MQKFSKFENFTLSRSKVWNLPLHHYHALLFYYFLSTNDQNCFNVISFFWYRKNTLTVLNYLKIMKFYNETYFRRKPKYSHPHTVVYRHILGHWSSIQIHSSTCTETIVENWVTKSHQGHFKIRKPISHGHVRGQITSFSGHFSSLMVWISSNLVWIWAIFDFTAPI